MAGQLSCRHDFTVGHLHLRAGRNVKTGFDDALVAKRNTDEISAKYPHASTVEMDGPHLLFLMRAKQLSEILIGFFNKSNRAARN